MENLFTSVASAQAFASAFSRASAGKGKNPRLSLNESLHCLAVASNFKNWATMKAHLLTLDNASNALITRPGIEARTLNQIEHASVYFGQNIQGYFSNHSKLTPANFSIWHDDVKTDVQAFGMLVNEARSSGYDILAVGTTELFLRGLGLDPKPRDEYSFGQLVPKEGDEPMELGVFVDPNSKSSLANPLSTDLRLFLGRRMAAHSESPSRKLLIVIEDSSFLNQLEEKRHGKEYRDRFLDEVWSCYMVGRKAGIVICSNFDSNSPGRPRRTISGNSIAVLKDPLPNASNE